MVATTDSPRAELFAYLNSLGIQVESFTHERASKCEDIARYAPNLPGLGVKNLFVGDLRRKRYFLVLVGHETRADLKALGKLLGAHLSFGPAPLLEELLGVSPGAVSVLGLFRDRERAITLVVDREVAEAPQLQFHPLVNNETVILRQADLRTFLAATGHILEVMGIPRAP